MNIIGWPDIDATEARIRSNPGSLSEQEINAKVWREWHLECARACESEVARLGREPDYADHRITLIDTRGRRRIRSYITEQGFLSALARIYRDPDRTLIDAV